jgi:hypothetical protein
VYLLFTGLARRYGSILPRGNVDVEFDALIEGGTSGGAVIDDGDLLVGVVSQAGGAEGQSQNGLIPRPHLALPAWVWNRILYPATG